MLRAVLDANVYISAALKPEGPPGKLIERFLREPLFDIVLSPAIVAEVQRALSYPKIRRRVPSDLDPLLWFGGVALQADIVTVSIQVIDVCEDPDDDKYLAAAVEGRAPFVVTGDRKLLAVKEYQGIHVIEPRVFLAMLGR